MKWRELVEEAKMLGYRVEEDEVWDADTGLHFTKKRSGLLFVYR